MTITKKHIDTENNYNNGHKINSSRENDDEDSKDVSCRKQRKGVKEMKTVEGFNTSNSNSNIGSPLKSSAKELWDFEETLQHNMEKMLPDLINFAKFTVLNVIIVWVIWKFGSHVIWYNSIPRNLLKSLYPPGYDYLKELLVEHQSNGSCNDVTKSGGNITVPAVYEPEQKEIFLERKKCCPGLELPFPEGQNIDMPCWPLSTTRDTLKNMEDRNYSYQVYNEDYTKCINYISWKNKEKADAENAKAAAEQAELVDLQSKAAERKQREGIQSGGLSMSDFTRENMYNKARGLATGAKDLALRAKENISQRIQDRADRKQRELEDSASLALASEDGAEMRYQDNREQLTAMRDKLLESIPEAGTETTIDLDSGIPVAPTAPGDGIPREIAREDGDMLREVVDPGKKAPVEVLDDAVKEEMKIADLEAGDSKQLTPIQVSQLMQQELQKEEKELDFEEKFKLDEKKAESKVAEDASKKESMLKSKYLKMEYKLVDTHKKNMAKLKDKIEKAEKMQNFNLARKLESKMQADELKHEKAKAQLEKAKTEGNLKDQIAAMKKLNKINANQTKLTDKISLESAKAGLASAGEAIKKALSWLFNAIPKLLIGLLRLIGGCSWDQGPKGLLLGPNTLNSLYTSFSLAVKSSISWVIYNCLSASGGNIIIAFLMGTVFLIIGMACIHFVWVSPLSTLWTLIHFKWPPLVYIASPLLIVIFGATFLIMYLIYSIMIVAKFWLDCFISSKGEKFKSQLKSCSNVQASLRRLFFLLTFINALKHLDGSVVVGMILCFIYIEYKQLTKGNK